MKMTRAKHSNQPTEREQYVIGLKGHCLITFKKPPIKKNKIIHTLTF